MNKEITRAPLAAPRRTARRRAQARQDGVVAGRDFGAPQRRQVDAAQPHGREKLAIVTPKPQTTRNRIVGVWNGPVRAYSSSSTRPACTARRKGLKRYMVARRCRPSRTSTPR